MSSPPPPPPAPPLPPPSLTTVVVSSRELLVSAICSAIVGAAFMLTWTVVRKPLRRIYLKRVVRLAGLRSLSGPVPPPQGMLLLRGAAARQAAMQPCLMWPCTSPCHMRCLCARPALQQITDLPVRPPPVPLMGSLMARCFGYLAPVFMVTDLELMQTAGMDALVSGVAGGRGCVSHSQLLVKAYIISCRRRHRHRRRIIRRCCAASSPWASKSSCP